MISTLIAFTPSERKISIIGALIIGLRLLGLFMILPIFSVYALGLMYATPQNIGITLGIYGLSAMIMQPVFGYLSDKHGRIKMIIIGLILFITGSLISAFAGSIYTMMLGRFLQGGGAISGVLLALVTDHTRPIVRSKSMAMISILITLCFIASIVLGPIIALHLGLEGLFALTAFLGLLALNLTVILPRNTPAEHEHLGIHLNKIKLVLANKTILLLYTSIFLLNVLLIASFVLLPTILLQNLHLSPNQTWWLYLISLLIAFIVMLILITLTEKFKAHKKTLLLSILLIIFAEAIFFSNFINIMYVLISLILFFTGFITLEALLPSWISRIADPGLEGTALGFFASAEFFGAFIGGLLGAYFSNAINNDLFLYLLGISVFWFLAVSTDLKKHPQ